MARPCGCGWLMVWLTKWEFPRVSCEHLYWAVTSQSGDQCGTRDRGRGCDILTFNSNVCIYSQNSSHDGIRKKVRVEKSSIYGVFLNPFKSIVFLQINWWHFFTVF